MRARFRSLPFCLYYFINAHLTFWGVLSSFSLPSCSLSFFLFLSLNVVSLPSSCFFCAFYCIVKSFERQNSLLIQFACFLSRFVSPSSFLSPRALHLSFFLLLGPVLLFLNIDKTTIEPQISMRFTLSMYLFISFFFFFCSVLGLS